MSQVSCNPIKSLSKRSYIAEKKEVRLPADIFEYQMDGLEAATKYACAVNASTMKGSGVEARIVVWTEAPGKLA